MKAVLIVKKRNGDYLAIQREIEEGSTMTFGELGDAAHIKSYDLSSDIRGMFSVKEPEAKDDIPF